MFQQTVTSFKQNIALESGMSERWFKVMETLQAFNLALTEILI